MTIAQIVYMVNDEIKMLSDDSTFTTAHIMFLLSKFRSALIKKQYLDKRNTPSSNNTQIICLDLEDYYPSSNTCVPGFRRSKQAIPNLLFESSAKVYPINFSLGVNFSLVPMERFPFVGNNKYMSSIIYCYIGADHHLYFSSSRPQTMYLEKVRIAGVFEDYETAEKMSCDAANNTCDIMEKEFPIEESLVPDLIQYTVKELLGAAYKPKDSINNANDDLADIVNWARNNMKSDLQKQIES